MTRRKLNRQRVNHATRQELESHLWRREFEQLLTRVQARARKYPISEVEIDAEVRMVRDEQRTRRLELALESAGKRLAPFEQKYRTTSAKFIATMSAEDLQGGDDEYVQWAGEYKLMQRLEEKLRQLKK